MSTLRVESLSLSLDGFGAGPGQALQHPLGVHGEELMEWLFSTRLGRTMHGQDGGDRSPRRCSRAPAR